MPAGEPTVTFVPAQLLPPVNRVGTKVAHWHGFARASPLHERDFSGERNPALMIRSKSITWWRSLGSDMLKEFVVLMDLHAFRRTMAYNAPPCSHLIIGFCPAMR